jgi:Fibronectin type III domain
VDGDGRRGTAGKLAGMLAVLLLGGVLLGVMFVGGRLLWVSLRGPETSPPVEASAGRPAPPASEESFASASGMPAAAGSSPGSSAAAQSSARVPEPLVPGASSSGAPGTSVPAKPSTGAATGSIRLAWDKSPDENVIGYKILFGTQPGHYPRSVNVGNQTTATLTGLERATKYYVVVIALDAQGKQSGPSNEIEIVVAR